MVDEKIRELEEALLEETKRLRMLQDQLIRGLEDLLSSVHLVLAEAGRWDPDEPS